MYGDQSGEFVFGYFCVIRDNGKNWIYTLLIDPKEFINRGWRGTKIANLESSLKICFIEFLRKTPAVLQCPKDFCQLPVTRLIKIYDSIKGDDVGGGSGGETEFSVTQILNWLSFMTWK